MVDRRPCLLRLLSSLVVLCCAGLMRSTGFSFSSTMTKAWNMSIAITKLARCCVMVPISTLAWQILQMTKVFLPLGLWASLRHHDLLALPLPGACSRVRQSLHYDLLQEYFSTYFYSRNTFKSSSVFRPRGVCGGHYLCTSAKLPGTLPLRTSSTYGRRPDQPSSSSLARRVCVQSPSTSSFLSSSTPSRTP